MCGSKAPLPSQPLLLDGVLDLCPVIGKGSVVNKPSIGRSTHREKMEIGVASRLNSFTANPLLTIPDFSSADRQKKGRRRSTVGIVLKLPYVDRPPSSTTVDDGDHDFHLRTRG